MNDTQHKTQLRWIRQAVLLSKEGNPEQQGLAEALLVSLWTYPTRRNPIDRTDLLRALTWPPVDTAVPEKAMHYGGEEEEDEWAASLEISNAPEFNERTRSRSKSSVEVVFDGVDDDGIVLDEVQQKAVLLMCTAPICVITGGPGTGKSTTLRKVLQYMDKHRETYALAAPTGKAAVRITETTGKPAMTLHRLLGYNPSGGFSINAGNPLDVSLVIVDEASMLDVSLFAALCSGIDSEVTRLVLVGDVDQLPSVGAGQVLGDIIDSDCVPVVRLETNHRAAAKSWVYANAPKVIRGEWPALEDQPTFSFHEVESDTKLIKRLVQIVTKDKATKNVLVLSPQNKGELGVDLLNGILQDEMNPPQTRSQVSWRLVTGHKVRVSDQVMQCKNNYDLGVFNGETGVVVNLDDKTLTVSFGDRVVEYTKTHGRDLKLSYAMTIHKSQGSQEDWVVVICHAMHGYMLSRQLLYTAITRAKEGVVLLGTREGIEKALGNDKPRERRTTLLTRIIELSANHNS